MLWTNNRAISELQHNIIIEVYIFFGEKFKTEQDFKTHFSSISYEREEAQKG